MSINIFPDVYLHIFPDVYLHLRKNCMVKYINCLLKLLQYRAKLNIKIKILRRQSI